MARELPSTSGSSVTCMRTLVCITQRVNSVSPFTPVDSSAELQVTSLQRRDGRDYWYTRSQRR